MDDGNLHIEESHTHNTQVQTQIAVTGCRIAYFFVWSLKDFFGEKKIISTLWLT